MSEKNNATILIVDDSHITRSKIEQVLAENGYTCILTAESAEKALALLETETPDIFLLDVMMPGIDGLELCRRIKQRPIFTSTPVLFVTGSVEEDSRCKGFEVGAADYIPKPFHPYELCARVGAHLEILFRQRANEKYAQEMEQLAEERARQLVHSERLSMLGILTAGIVHEINNSVGCITSNAQLMEMALPHLIDMVDYAFEHGIEQTHKRKMVIQTMRDGITDIKEGVLRTSQIARNILHFSRKGSDELEPVNLNLVIAQALMVCHNRLKYHMTVENIVPRDIPMIFGKSSTLAQVFVNLLVNAADAAEGIKDARICIDAHQEGDHVICTVTDNGSGMSEDVQEHIWDSFFTTKPKDKGTGLGLCISKQIIREMEGDISVSSVLGEGTTFTLTLKVV